jgi:Family of unknown function (DUF5675)
VHLEVKRDTFTSRSTIGKLYIDGKFFAFTLEDPQRELGVKIYGNTAIPKGTYTVIWNKSTRFSKEKGKDVFMPLLLDVPGFSGVRIHSGSFPADTLGCILVGYNKGKDFINGSRDAIKALYPLIQKAASPITITVS